MRSLLISSERLLNPHQLFPLPSSRPLRGGTTSLCACGWLAVVFTSRRMSQFFGQLMGESLDFRLDRTTVCQWAALVSWWEYSVDEMWTDIFFIEIL